MPRSLRILVVEDEMTIALLMEDMLHDLGHDVVGLAMRLPQAMKLAETAEIDLAILDVNIDGRTSVPVADVLQARGVPFIFATGYGAASVDPAYKSPAIVKKPFDLADLRGAIDQAAG